MNNHRMILWTTILAAALLAAACGSSPSTPLKISAEENGKNVSLQKGQTLEITLESNPTTGYNWEVVDAAEGILKQAGEPEYLQSNPQDKTLVGAGGAETFRFEAAGSGTATLKLVYHRSWEKNVEPIKTFEVTVDVR